MWGSEGKKRGSIVGHTSKEKKKVTGKPPPPCGSGENQLWKRERKGNKPLEKSGEARKIKGLSIMIVALKDGIKIGLENRGENNIL